MDERLRKKVTARNAERAQQAALLRLHLYEIGETHRILRMVLDEISGELLRSAYEDGKVDGLGLVRTQTAAEEAWRRGMGEWQRLLRAMMREAASLPFATLATFHNEQIAPLAAVKEENRKRRWAEAVTVRDYTFQPQLDVVMRAAEERIYGDGLRLSQRVWNLSQVSLQGINSRLMAGVSKGESAWEIAKDLEQYLGANQDCPRWTHDRLYRTSKAEIASGERRGLIGGDACDGQGVAYKALRMARQEIQAIHHAANREMMRSRPWITAEKIHLSPEHPDIECECPDIAKGGEKNDGVYPVGEIELPIHIGCLCYSTAEQPPTDELARDWAAWTMGGSDPRFDAYAAAIGGGRESMSQPLGGIAVGAVAAWLWDSADDLVRRIWRGDA